VMEQVITQLQLAEMNARKGNRWSILKISSRL
jgi:hypothetical protein